MKHYADPAFWDCYHNLQKSIQELADKNFDLLKTHPQHPSLHLKKIKKYYSVRVGKKHRALGIQSEEGDTVWFWIGTHAEYDKLIK